MKALLVSLSLILGHAQLFAQSVDALNRLSAGDVSSVENAYSTLQHKFEKGLATEYDLLDAYKIFYHSEDRYRPQLNRWIKTYPKSASAYLARGIYYRKLGGHRRGSKYISETPPEDVKYMEQMFVLSKQDLEMSLRLNPKSYLAILHLLNIAQYEGDDAAATRFLSLGNAVLPSNFILRARYLIHLTPRWGGSYKQMDKFIDQCRSQGMPEDKVDLLNAIKFDDQGKTAEERRSNSQACAAFGKALTLSTSGGQRFRKDYLGWSVRAQQYCQ